MSAVEAYLAAKTAFEEIQASISKIAAMLQNTASALSKQPGRMIFSNVRDGLPMEASMSRDSISINSNDWMSAEELQSVLAEWHKRNSAMMSAWHAVPETMQRNLAPPEADRRYR